MKYAVIVSKEARKDLYDIFTYIAKTLQVPKAATKQILRLEEKILALSEMPERYRVYKNLKNQTVRIFPVDNYCVFYAVDKKKCNVNIVRVLYGARDFQACL